MIPLSLPKLKTDLLWPIIILIGFLCFVSLVPQVPNDFWWHLKIGEVIFETHRIPTSNEFGWSLPSDYPFFYGAWLSELLLYFLFWLGKLELVLFTRNLLAGIAFFSVVILTYHRTNSWRLGALSLAFAAGMTLNNLIVRPQIWSWIPFVTYLIILTGFVQGRYRARALLLCPVMMLFWVNVHGAFILGGVMIGIFFIGEAVRTLFHSAGSLSWQKVGSLLATGIITGMAMLANPRGIGIVSYVIDLLTDQPSQGLIQEWQSPTPAGPANLVFYISLLVLIIVLAYTRFKPTITELLLILCFLWLAWSGQRYVVWFGIVAMPILAQAVQQLPVPVIQLTSQRNLFNTLIVLLLFIPLLIVQPWFVENVPLPASFWDQVHKNVEQGPLITRDTPLLAVDYLREHPGGNLFNDMGYGSYLIWALPQQKVFIDPRVELYPYEQWEDYIRIIRGARYNQLLTEYGADRLLLDKNRQSELANIIIEDPGWIQEYADAQSEIWKRIR